MRLSGAVFILVLVVLFGNSCSGTPETIKRGWRVEPLSKYGNPPFYKVNGKRYYTLSTSRGYKEKGIASWYGAEFDGQRTSSGEIFDMYAMTAAHRSLPLPSYVQVTNLENGRQVVVRVNDRGPFHPGRIIDLSYGAAVKLGFAREGTGRVEIRAINPRTGEPYPLPDEELMASLERAFYLQVGAFQSRQRAKRLQQRLQAWFEAAVSVSLTQQPPTFYRVRIGPLSNAEKLDNFAKRLADLGVSDSIIVH